MPHLKTACAAAMSLALAACGTNELPSSDPSSSPTVITADDSNIAIEFKPALTTDTLSTKEVEVEVTGVTMPEKIKGYRRDMKPDSNEVLVVVSYTLRNRAKSPLEYVHYPQFELVNGVGENYAPEELSFDYPDDLGLDTRDGVKTINPGAANAWKNVWRLKRSAWESGDWTLQAKDEPEFAIAIQ